jgi:hypothetical protein
MAEVVEQRTPRGRITLTHFKDINKFVVGEEKPKLTPKEAENAH